MNLEYSLQFHNHEEEMSAEFFSDTNVSSLPDWMRSCLQKSCVYFISNVESKPKLVKINQKETQDSANFDQIFKR
jgi:hypothetical protein